MGDVSSLFPPGITHMADLPHHLADALAKGLAYVGFDELPSEERPPRSIWLNSDKLKDWFEEVEKKRKAKYGGEGDKEIEDPVQNEAASALIAE